MRSCQCPISELQQNVVNFKSQLHLTKLSWQLFCTIRSYWDVHDSSPYISNIEALPRERERERLHFAVISCYFIQPVTIEISNKAACIYLALCFLSSGCVWQTTIFKRTVLLCSFLRFNVISHLLLYKLPLSKTQAICTC